jgi:bifunctional non-homologous end joining protein LigD
MSDRLAEYRRKRDPKKTPEPFSGVDASDRHRFVIHQHHARSLHWDLRLEHDGVLASWAVPRGLPRDPARNHLAVHTEDHPMEYLEFAGTIPAGEYGGGRMLVYDTGTYETQKWRDREVMIVLHGSKVSGRYVLFQTNGSGLGRAGGAVGRAAGNAWMIHRMDPPPDGWTPMPTGLTPALSQPAKRLPAKDAEWAFELEWPGRRQLVAVSGGRAETDVPELRALGGALAPTECLLDGVVVAFLPNVYFVFDLLWLDGKSTVDLAYASRRELLEGLELNGPHWQTPPHFTGGGRFALDTARDQGLPGVIAKRLSSTYTKPDWRRIPTG